MEFAGGNLSFSSGMIASDHPRPPIALKMATKDGQNAYKNHLTILKPSYKNLQLNSIKMTMIVCIKI